MGLKRKPRNRHARISQLQPDREAESGKRLAFSRLVLGQLDVMCKRLHVDANLTPFLRLTQRPECKMKSMELLEGDMGQNLDGSGFAEEP